MPNPRVYNIKLYKIPTLLPAMILAFEDESILGAVYSYVLYYLDNSVANEAEKIRSKATFKDIISKFFNKKNF